MAGRSILRGAGEPACLAERRSRASQRVCRSTFAAEAVSCAEGAETAMAARGVLAEALGCASCAIPVVLVTDCKSCLLYTSPSPRD
eukprot:6078363-Alexandrium_andersonii.AAC.1